MANDIVVVDPFVVVVFVVLVVPFVVRLVVLFVSPTFRSRCSFVPILITFWFRSHDFVCYIVWWFVFLVHSVRLGDFVDRCGESVISFVVPVCRSRSFDFTSTTHCTPHCTACTHVHGLVRSTFGLRSIPHGLVWFGFGYVPAGLRSVLTFVRLRSRFRSGLIRSRFRLRFRSCWYVLVCSLTDLFCCVVPLIVYVCCDCSRLLSFLTVSLFLCDYVYSLIVRLISLISFSFLVSRFRSFVRFCLRFVSRSTDFVRLVWFSVVYLVRWFRSVRRSSFVRSRSFVWFTLSFVTTPPTLGSTRSLHTHVTLHTHYTGGPFVRYRLRCSFTGFTPDFTFVHVAFTVPLRSLVTFVSFVSLIWHCTGWVGPLVYTPFFDFDRSFGFALSAFLPRSLLICCWPFIVILTIVVVICYSICCSFPFIWWIVDGDHSLMPFIHLLVPRSFRLHSFHYSTFVYVRLIPSFLPRSFTFGIFTPRYDPRSDRCHTTSFVPPRLSLVDFYVDLFVRSSGWILRFVCSTFPFCLVWFTRWFYVPRFVRLLHFGNFGPHSFVDRSLHWFRSIVHWSIYVLWMSLTSSSLRWSYVLTRFPRQRYNFIHSHVSRYSLLRCSDFTPPFTIPSPCVLVLGLDFTVVPHFSLHSRSRLFWFLVCIHLGSLQVLLTSGFTASLAFTFVVVTFSFTFRLFWSFTLFPLVRSFTSVPTRFSCTPHSFPVVDLGLHHYLRLVPFLVWMITFDSTRSFATFLVTLLRGFVVVHLLLVVGSFVDLFCCCWWRNFGPHSLISFVDPRLLEILFVHGFSFVAISFRCSFTRFTFTDRSRFPHTFSLRFRVAVVSVSHVPLQFYVVRCYVPFDFDLFRSTVRSFVPDFVVRLPFSWSRCYVRFHSCCSSLLSCCSSLRSLPRWWFPRLFVVIPWFPDSLLLLFDFSFHSGGDRCGDSFVFLLFITDLHVSISRLRSPRSTLRSAFGCHLHHPRCVYVAFGDLFGLRSFPGPRWLRSLIPLFLVRFSSGDFVRSFPAPRWWYRSRLFDFCRCSPICSSSFLRFTVPTFWFWICSWSWFPRSRSFSLPISILWFSPHVSLIVR